MRGPLDAGDPDANHRKEVNVKSRHKRWTGNESDACGCFRTSTWKTAESGV
jgi:hypothetical protein